MARKVGSSRRSPPSSPQMPIQMPLAWAASAAIFRARRTAGWWGSKNLPRSLHWRSQARVYWVRSLVPTEKKSTCLARSLAMSTEAGVSIIMPISVSGLKGIPSSASSCITLSQARRHSLISHTEVIMGNMMATLP